MKLIVHRQAEIEAGQAASWYGEKQPHLRTEFLDELDHALRAIESNPTGQPLLESTESSNREVRRCVLKRFPYLVVYTIQDNHVLVVAITHAHREPDYWIDRVP